MFLESNGIKAITSTKALTKTVSPADSAYENAAVANTRARKKNKRRTRVEPSLR